MEHELIKKIIKAHLNEPIIFIAYAGLLLGIAFIIKILIDIF
jgi:hypothetical protein